VNNGSGVLGRVSAYIGVTESQGRGTLHLHALLWLCGAPTSDRLAELLRSDGFRDRIRCFLRNNCRASIDGINTQQDLDAVPSCADVAYSRPPNPSSATYDDEGAALERTVACTKQRHKCSMATCLRATSSGALVCKRRAPWPLAEEDTVAPDGRYTIRRCLPYLNAWNPAITRNLRCNNDLKVLTNGQHTRGVTFYVSMYATKKQGRSYNTCALWATSLVYHFQQSSYLDKLQDQQKSLLFRAVNTMNRQQEIAAPLVMSYLLGYGDTFRSHRYVPLYTAGVYYFVIEKCPGLRK